MKFILKQFAELSTRELFGIYLLRAKVFVVEQNCPYQDVDNKDLDSLHLMALRENQLIGYSRIIPPGISYPEVSIGRVVVDKEHRGTGTGRELMKQSIHEACIFFGCNEIVISAQTYLLDFYKSLDFNPEGPEYLEDDIPHISMRWQKK